MKVYGKVYGKPPPGAKRKQRPNSSESEVDLARSRTSSRSSVQDFEDAGSREQSATASLPSIRAKATVIHQPAKPPRSATFGRGSVTFGRNSTGSASSGSLSSKSTPIRNRKSAQVVTTDDEEELIVSSAQSDSRRSSLKLTHDDQLLFSQSDQLCREVLSLCQGSEAVQISGAYENDRCRQGQRSNALTETLNPTFQVTHDGGGDAGFNIDGQELTSLPCLSLLDSVASTPMNTARGTARPLSATYDNELTHFENPAKPEKDEMQSSQTSINAEKSINSNSPSHEYDYRKVFGIIRMIEEEEAKGSEIAACFGNFLKEKYVGSAPSGNGNEAEMERKVAQMSPHSSRPMSPQSSAGRLEFQQRDRSDFGGFRPATSERSFPTALSSPCRGQSLQGNETPPLHSSRSDNTCYMETYFGEVKGQSQPLIQEARGQQPFHSNHNDEWITERSGNPGSSRSSHISEPWENADAKSQTLLSFLDEVEQSDKDKLFQLKFNQDGIDPITVTSVGQCQGSRRPLPRGTQPPDGTATVSRLDALIRRGSAELAREILMLERQNEDSAHNVHILEETLLSQRELNIRNMKNSEKDSKKRLKLQQEEFELTVSRHQAFVDQLIVEKRSLQEKCEKVLKESKETEEKYQGQIKSLQEKHLEEIKRLRKIQENTEKTKKQKWVGQKTQEIRDMTVKGLEPEVQRLIQRHQQEMAETRAYYTDEMQEIEERYARKQSHQLQELRENFNQEKEEACRRERENLQKRFEFDFQRQLEELETQKRRWLKEMQEEKDRLSAEEGKVRESAQENLRKGQIKCEVELENVRQEFELKISQIEKRHEREIQSLRDNFESQRENWISTFNKKNEQILAEREAQLIEILNKDKEKELREREKKCKEDFEKIRQEEATGQELRIKRLQEKFQLELEELEKSERELKQKFSAVKTEVIEKEEELFSLRTTLGLRTKENSDLTEANIRMLEERVNLTSIIRREFTAQIQVLEDDCSAVKAAVVELKAKNKLDLEMNQINFEKFRNEKDAEFERIGQRVKQTLARKEETLIELGKQLEKSQIRINHLEQLLEQQRKDFVKSMTTPTAPNTKKK